MADYGYHRIGTKKQHEDRGVFEIKQFCGRTDKVLAADVFVDKKTGKNFDRVECQFIKGRIMTGDTLIITEMDRLGRDKVEILNELKHFCEKGVYVIILEIPTTQIDYSDLPDSLAKMMIETINNLIIEVYAILAQTEIEKKEKRQREGISAMKRRGEWDDYGRPRKLDIMRFGQAYTAVELVDITNVECMRILGISKASYYRYKAMHLKQPYRDRIE